jgi:hypothetical protein
VLIPLSACERAGFVRGEKTAMIAHLVGKTKCPHASKDARKAAIKIRDENKRKKDEAGESEADNESDSDGQVKKKQRTGVFGAVQRQMKQTELKVFKGIEIPFSEKEVAMVRQQVLRATISANLPFQWIENPEVIKLFTMFRSVAPEILPGRQTISGTLLNDASETVEETMMQELRGAYAVIS